MLCSSIEGDPSASTLNPLSAHPHATSLHPHPFRSPGLVVLGVVVPLGTAWWLGYHEGELGSNAFLAVWGWVWGSLFLMEAVGAPGAVL